MANLENHACTSQQQGASGPMMRRKPWISFDGANPSILYKIIHISRCCPSLLHHSASALPFSKRLSINSLTTSDDWQFSIRLNLSTATMADIPGLSGEQCSTLAFVQVGDLVLVDFHVVTRVLLNPTNQQKLLKLTTNSRSRTMPIWLQNRG